MKRFIIFTLVIFNFGCSTKKEHNINRVPYYLERLKFTDEIRSNNFKYVIEISKTAKDYNTLNEVIGRMQRKIKEAIINELDSVSLNEFFDRFKNQDIIDCSFWKTSKVDIETSLYILERLCYELGRSEVSNDYFLFDQVDLVCDTIGKNEYILKWDVNSYNFGESIIIRSKLNDSIVRYENFYIDKKIQSLKLKENEKIDGVVFRKLNNAKVVKIDR